MLVELLEKEAVPFETLHTRYGSMLELVRKLLGVVPNCDPYLTRLADANPGARDLVQPGRGGSERARVLSGDPAGGDRRTGDVRLGTADAAPALELLPGDRHRAPRERVG